MSLGWLHQAGCAPPQGVGASDSSARSCQVFGESHGRKALSLMRKSKQGLSPLLHLHRVRDTELGELCARTERLAAQPPRI